MSPNQVGYFLLKISCKRIERGSFLLNLYFIIYYQPRVKFTACNHITTIFNRSERDMSSQRHIFTCFTYMSFSNNSFFIIFVPPLSISRTCDLCLFLLPETELQFNFLYVLCTHYIPFHIFYLQYRHYRN